MITFSNEHEVKFWCDEKVFIWKQGHLEDHPMNHAERRLLHFRWMDQHTNECEEMKSQASFEAL